MVKVNVVEILTGLDGEDMEYPVQSCPTCHQKVGEEGKPVTVRSVLEDALLWEKPRQQGDPEPDGRDRIERCALALKVHENDTIELEADQVTKIMSNILLIKSSFVYFRMNDILDPKVTPPAE